MILLTSKNGGWYNVFVANLKTNAKETEMYDQVMHQGKMLTVWAQLFNNQFSLGELYRMAKGGQDFYRLERQ